MRRRLENGASVDFDEPRRRRKPLSGFYVYAIGDAEARFIKFGHARDPAPRLTVLQVATPMELRLLAAFLVETKWDAFNVEGLLHIASAPYHIRGEWFRSSPRTLAFVEWMRKPNFLALIADAARETQPPNPDGVRIRRQIETAKP